MSQTREQSQLALRERVRARRPPLYLVLMHNDDYSTMDFVIEMLVSIFQKNQQEAVQIMLDVHKKGRGVCGIYPREIAETKIHLVHDRAREAGYPLRCSMEKQS